MKIKYKKVALWLIGSVALLYGNVYANKNNLSPLETLRGIFLGLTIQSCARAIGDCFDISTWEEQLKMYQRKQIIKKEDFIRISFAYLYRIKVDGKYLLVSNGRGTGKYQPVGGAYKTFDKEKNYLKSHYLLAEDDKIPVDALSKNDYRMFVPSRKLKKFVRRFSKTSDRELVKDLKREFKEELINTGIVDFDKIRYRYCGRHFSGINFSRHFQCYELLLADIVELLPTPEQEEKLRQIAMEKSDKYCIATSKEIKHCGIIEGTAQLQETIGDHSFKILEETEQFLQIKRREKKIYEVVLK